MMRDDDSDKKSNGANGSGKEPGSDRPRGKPVPEEITARVRKIAYEALPPRARATTNLYLDPWAVPTGTTLGPSFEPWVAERESVLCFADFEPQANFSHPCSYFLHDAGTGELLRRVPAQFPPYPLEGIHLLDLIHEAPRIAEVPVKQEEQRCGDVLQARMQPLLARSAPAAGRRYAILFSGVSDPHHVNDLELCFRTLTTFGFTRIFVLVHNGTKTGAPFLDKQRHLRPWPGATTAPDNQFRLMPDGKGSRKAFNTVLAQLSQDLQPGDLLYVHTEGHGGVRYGTNAGQYLYCVPDGPGSTDRYMDFEMQSDLQQIQGYNSLLVVMNQCYSGGFMDSVLAGSKAQRTFFAAACAQNKLAYATTDLKWNRFSRNWIEREKLNDADGKVEAREAYAYCDDDTVRGPDTPLDGRMPLPGTNNHSPADEIVLR